MPMNAIARSQLLAVARDLVGHAHAGTTPLAPGIMEIDAALYTDPERFEREKRLVFRRLPLMLAASCELPGPGAYKAMEVAGVPVLVVRGKDGRARAFLNVCTHRGAILADGCGTASRFACPYHGWTFDSQGALVGVASRGDFGDVDMAAKGLRPFPVLERAGLIWAVLDPDSTLDMGAFLAGFGDMLEMFGFEDWHFLQRRTLVGANWKLAFDAHLEFYHLPVLHRDTFGPTISPKAFYYHWGPHQRLTRPGKPDYRTMPEHANLFAMDGKPDAEWTDEAMMLGEWILYPNVSINTFYDGGRGVIISQIFPGETVDVSYTVQTYLMEKPPADEAARASAEKLCDFLGHVVNEEDLPTSIRQQRALESGLLPKICFGRNEGGLQQFHRWTDRILETGAGGLDALFRDGL
jgi:phenylpropionate dioxygenase-like ring-hydroxylating dioxygenase large terminal subunit